MAGRFVEIVPFIKELSQSDVNMSRDWQHIAISRGRHAQSIAIDAFSFVEFALLNQQGRPVAVREQRASKISARSPRSACFRKAISCVPCAANIVIRLSQTYINNATPNQVVRAKICKRLLSDSNDIRKIGLRA